MVPPAILQVVDRNVLDVVALGNDGTPRFENERLETFFGEFFRGPASGDSGADDDRVIGIGCHSNLPYAFFCGGTGSGTQPWDAPGMICKFNSLAKPISGG